MEIVLSTRSDVDAQFVFTVGGAFGTGNADENTVGAIYRDEVDFANSVISIFNYFAASLCVNRIAGFCRNCRLHIRWHWLIAAGRLSERIEIDCLGFVGGLELNFYLLACRQSGSVEHMVAVEHLESSAGETSYRALFRPLERDLLT